MRRSKRRDDNEPEIVQAFRARGASVTRLDDAGVPDLLVGFRRVTKLVEVKMPMGVRGGLPAHRDHEGGRGDLTRAQVAWWDSWLGDPAVIVRTVDDAHALIDVIDREVSS